MSDIPKQAYRCHCGGQRHKHDIQRIERLEGVLRKTRDRLKLSTYEIDTVLGGEDSGDTPGGEK